MTTKRPSPLVGHNTGIRYRGAPYHVQTEDSGIDHPHVITHLFAEGGHILATRKTSYAEHVGTSAYPEVVRQIIRTQHKDMLVALRDGIYDDILARASHPVAEPAASVEAVPRVAPAIQPAPAAREQTPATLLRARRTSLSGRDCAQDSLDEIIIADLILVLDE